MFDSVSVDYDGSDVAPYAASMEDAKVKSAVNVLARMFPDVKDIPHDAKAVTILDRAMSYMLHLDKKFDTNQTFDADHYEKMVNEANIYTAWLESDDLTFPEELKYHTETIAETPENDAGDVPAPIEVVDRGERKKRTASPTSRYQRGLAMYREDVAKGVPRAATVARCVAELGLNPGTANMYYSKYKNER